MAIHGTQDTHKGGACIGSELRDLGLERRHGLLLAMLLMMLLGHGAGQLYHLVRDRVGPHICVKPVGQQPPFRAGDDSGGGVAPEHRHKMLAATLLLRASLMGLLGHGQHAHAVCLAVLPPYQQLPVHQHPAVA